MIRVTIDPARPLGPQLMPAVEALRDGQVVAYPTDTLYGLAVDPRSEAALDRLFAVKGRDADRRVALICAHRKQAGAVAEIAGAARRLAEQFWPGPLTLLLPARPGIAARSRSADGRVGIRVPDHAVARALAAGFGFAVTATSANRSGEPARSCPDLVAESLPAIDVLVDAGPSPGGLASTLIAIDGDAPQLIREGALPWSRVLEFLASPSR